ncbi:MAG: SRPBCC family protein [Phycisphaeraceae bacterium]|nr:SRPBCC family protein [Phycisphaeraceae bacterium]
MPAATTDQALTRARATQTSPHDAQPIRADAPTPPIPAPATPDTFSQAPLSPGRWLLHSRVTVPAHRDQVFPFFQSPENLEQLTPPWLNFRIITPTPIPMRPGAIIDYRISLRGLPMRWRTLIESFDPPARFIDTQVRGPYRLWRHEHLFEPITLPDGRDATIITDRVEYALRWPANTGPLANLIHRRLVAPDLQRIFKFRSLRMRELFGSLR